MFTTAIIERQERRKIMKKIIIVFMVVIMTLIMSGCGEAPKPTLSPEGVETIVTETILYENVLTYWD